MNRRRKDQARLRPRTTGKRALLLTGALLAVVAFTASLTIVAGQALGDTSGVCGRTSQVSTAITTASGAGSCSLVTSLHLSDVTSLDLSGQSISSLSADDFDGLIRLRELDLSDNSLTSLPAGIFDELFLLRTLRLDDNALTTLPSGIFDQLFLLEELTLSGNADLSLPADLFGDFSLFDGIQSNGDLATDTGDSPRIDRFLTKHSVTSPEEFIGALPALYKERFTIIYKSRAPAQDHVSGEHPRIISFGGDGRLTFAWNTDPDAPSEFLDTVEFLRQNGDDWTAGVIDFAGDSPSITAPASCQTCHGSLNKPLWSGWSDWEGTEFVYPEDKQYASVVAYMRGLLESSDQRIEQLDFSASRFYSGNYAERFLKSPGRSIYVAAVVEAGAVWSWRHAEVLFSRLKDRYTDFPQYAEQLMCGSTSNALYTLSSQFDQRDHNLSVLATIDDGDITPEGLLDRASAYVSNTYHYQTDGSIGDAVNFLTLFELWEQDPIVRKLYRDTSNEDTVLPENAWLMDVYLHYGPGKATAEDELIQKFRLHFGRGNRAALDARAGQNESMLLGFVPSASFWDGHLEVMRPRVCKALRNSEPENLRATRDGANTVLDWDAPTYDADSITGYRILRGTGDEELSVLVSSTDTKDTEWTDEDPAEGDYVYAVQTVYDDYYHSSESDQVRQTVAARPNTAATGKPTISGTAQVGETLTADTSGIADSDGLNNIPYSYQWVRERQTPPTRTSAMLPDRPTPWCLLTRARPSRSR